VSDELASAKLVLPWLLGALGAPAFLVGLLVPIRESGSLLPQLVVGAAIRRFPLRKWFWVAGSVLQGLAVLLMALTAVSLEGAAAGWIIVGLLVLLSLARGMASVASKDVLGKTVSKTRRGTLMGYSAALAGIATIAVGNWARARGEDADATGFLLGMLLAAGVLWLAAAVLFSFIKEQPGATEGGGKALSVALESLGLLRADPAFRRFVFTRALFLSTALAMPFYVILARELGGGLASLGLLVIASGLAGALSAPVWGRLADRSSRQTLVLAGTLAGLVGVTVFAASALQLSWLTGEYAVTVAFLLMGVAHSGVRIGRKTYLVDMATAETRSAFVAVSNTAIGVLLLLGGAAVGLAAQLVGAAGVILVLALAALAAAGSSLRLAEVTSGSK
jgi:MFS family permease